MEVVYLPPRNYYVRQVEIRKEIREVVSMPKVMLAVILFK